MISRAGELLAAIVRYSGAAALVRATIARRRASIVLYHDPDPDELDRQLRFLAQHHSIIALDRLVDAMVDGSWSDLPPRSLVVTFDDGHAGNARLAPVLAWHGIRPTLFLCTQIVGTRRGFWWHGLPRDVLEQLKVLPDQARQRVLADRGVREDEEIEPRQALDRAEITALAGTCDFGAHGRFHPVLPRCDAAHAEEEIAVSRGEVEHLTGRRCDHFAYPAGAYGARETAMVAAAGYRSARTVDTGWVRPGTDSLHLPVLSIDPPTVTLLAAELAGLKWLARLVPRKGDLRGRRLFRPRPSRGWRATGLGRLAAAPSHRD